MDVEPEPLARILIVDDSAFVRHFVTSALTEHGFSVLDARDWSDVREVLRGGQTLDLILLDVNLPGMRDGDEMAITLRKHPITRDAKIVLFSSTSLKKLSKLARQRGLDDYIQKGLTGPTLLGHVQQLTGTTPVESPPPTASKTTPDKGIKKWWQ